MRNTTLARPDRCFDPCSQMPVHVDVVSSNNDVLSSLPPSDSCDFVDLCPVVHEAGSP
jgi:hypothetical protein